ncbi:hypothetical protein ACFV27_36825 [Streptomyces antimycoticus]|uniref:hypothetical protein n=1 Tax=Streptomyces antimycoticus TaxID=68175 RepID=UPI0036B29484
MNVWLVVPTTVIALAAAVAWWRARRALLLERAVRRIGDAAAAREHAGRLDLARRVLRRRLAEEAVLREADRVLDAALAQYHQFYDTEGGSDG